jgi:hypothetical protein
MASQPDNKGYLVLTRNLFLDDVEDGLGECEPQDVAGHHAEPHGLGMLAVTAVLPLQHSSNAAQQ